MEFSDLQISSKRSSLLKKNRGQFITVVSKTRWQNLELKFTCGVTYGNRLICQTGRYILTIGSSNLITVRDSVTPKMMSGKLFSSPAIGAHSYLQRAFLPLLCNSAQPAPKPGCQASHTPVSVCTLSCDLEEQSPYKSSLPFGFFSWKEPRLAISVACLF